MSRPRRKERELLLGGPNEASHECANPYCLPLLVNPNIPCAAVHLCN